MMTVKGDSVTAVDLTRVVMIQSTTKKESKSKDVLTTEDLKFQEERRKRKEFKIIYFFLC